MAAEIDPGRQREFATDVVARLRAAGHVAYWAGGCVRDALLGRVPKDYDVATSARPDEIRALFGERRTLAIGAAFGVITVLGKKQDATGPIEVATFREDMTYSDGRHPDAVVFSTPQHDAQRRDFTINGLFHDPLAGEVLDFVGGQADLGHKLIRAIGAPEARFTEDKLRLLRAVRFAVRFGFAIEPATRAAIEKMAGQIGAVSIERIAMELRLILLDPQRAQGVRLLDELGLLPAIARIVGVDLPSDAKTGDDRWRITIDVLSKLDAPSFPLALAAMLHRFLEGGDVSKLGLDLKLSKAETERTVWLVRHVAKVLDAHLIRWPELQGLLVHDGSADLLALADAVVAATGSGASGVEHCRRQLSLPPEELNPPPVVTGDDLVSHGVPRGPIYATLLEAVRDAQLEKQVTNKAEALKLVDKLLREADAAGSA